MSGLVIKGKDLLEPWYSYTRHKDWLIAGKHVPVSQKRTVIAPLDPWHEVVCYPESLYHRDSGSLVADIHNAIRSVDDTYEIWDYFLDLIISYCCPPSLNYIPLTALITQIRVNDDMRSHNEWAHHVLDDRKEEWRKWCNIRRRRWSKGIPNSDVLIMAVYFERPVIVDRYMICTANDCEHRDPTDWVILATHSKNINRNPNRAIDHVIDERQGNSLLPVQRYTSTWFNIDRKKAYPKKDKQLGKATGYDLYIFAVKGTRGRGPEVQISQIKFECCDDSKKGLVQEFDQKLTRLVQSYCSKGLSQEQVLNIFIEKINTL